jgi:LacI family transcriptional regulator
MISTEKNLLVADIAREAGVSPATVSRAINQPQIVSPERLKRILDVMARHNYQPAPIERRRGPKARLGKQRRIGVWFVGTRLTPGHKWFQEQLSELQQTDIRYRLDLYVTASASPSELPRLITTENLDGIIVQGIEPTTECLAKLAGKPYVWFMTRRSADYAGDYIEPNNEENGHLAADYLKSRGHSTVAIVATDPDYPAIQQRARAFTDRAHELGLTVQTILGAPRGASYLQVAPLHGEAAELAHRFRHASPKPTGVYLPADHYCGAFFHAMRQASQHPGRDFEAILGNYNPSIYRHLDHTPAAIDINRPMLMRKVVEHLLWRIEKNEHPGRVGFSISPRLLPNGPTSRSGQPGTQPALPF